MNNEDKQYLVTRKELIKLVRSTHSHDTDVRHNLEIIKLLKSKKPVGTLDRSNVWDVLNLMARQMATVQARAMSGRAPMTGEELTKKNVKLQDEATAEILSLIPQQGKVIASGEIDMFEEDERILIGGKDLGVIIQNEIPMETFDFGGGKYKSTSKKRYELIIKEI